MLLSNAYFPMDIKLLLIAQEELKKIELEFLPGINVNLKFPDTTFLKRALFLDINGLVAQ